MIKYIDKWGHSFYENMELFISIKIDDCKNIIPTEDEINQSKQKKYLDLYEQYIKFLQKPHKLSKDFWSGTIADISRIIGLSSEKLNQIVSKNIKPIGTSTTINGNNFDDAEWGS